MTGKTGGQEGSFLTTRWSLVARAGDDDSEVRRAALDELLRMYAGPLTRYLVKKKGVRSDHADDLIQGFTADKILEHDLFRHADPGEGKLRSLLVTALDRYLIDVIRRSRRQKRSAEDAISLEQIGRDIGDVTDDPADAILIDWATRSLMLAIAQMRSDCQTLGREREWCVFESRFYQPMVTGAKPEPYPQLADRLGFQSPKQASNEVRTALRRLQRTLRGVLAVYAIDDSEIDDELRAFRDAIRAAGPVDWECGVERVNAQAASSSAVELDLRLFASRVDHDEIWLSDERAALWGHQLRSTIRDYLADADGLDSQQLEALCTIDPTIKTLGDLLRHPRPPLEVLRAVKRQARWETQSAGDSLPTEIEFALYCACIGASWNCHEESISKLPGDDQQDRIRTALDYPWLDDTTRCLLEATLSRLRKKGKSNVTPPS